MVEGHNGNTDPCPRPHALRSTGPQTDAHLLRKPEREAPERGTRTSGPRDGKDLHGTEKALSVQSVKLESALELRTSARQTKATERIEGSCRLADVSKGLWDTGFRPPKGQNTRTRPSGQTCSHATSEGPTRRPTLGSRKQASGYYGPGEVRQDWEAWVF